MAKVEKTQKKLQSKFYYARRERGFLRSRTVFSSGSRIASPKNG